MQHGDDADIRAQALGIGGQFKHGFLDRPEQEIIEAFFIAQGKWVEFMRDGKDHMKIPDRQQFPESVIDPGEARGGLTPGTVAVAAGMKTNDFMTATVAVFHLSAQCGRAARNNGINDLAVME
jgi:hypothetical protein